MSNAGLRHQLQEFLRRTLGTGALTDDARRELNELVGLCDVPGEQTADPEEAFSGRPICQSYEGCHGYGYLDDLTDSGSGRMVYCDCPAGTNLKTTDEARIGLSEKLPENLWPPDFGPGRRDELAEERVRRYVREDGTPK